MTASASDYAVVLLRRGPAWEEGKSLGEQHGVHEHIGFLASRYEEGVVERAGPFHRPEDVVGEGELVGLVVYSVGAERAKEYAEQDPGFLSGLLELSVFPWHP